MYTIDSMEKGRIHCIGIGGIGLSALAQYFLHNGYKVTGTDSTESKITYLLRSKGIEINIGNTAEDITKDIQTIFYTAALDNNHPGLVKARELQIPMFTYSQGLGLISKNKKTIAIAGSHGKTSTTAMVAHVLRNAGKDPSVIIGSLLAKDGTNFIAGESDLFVVEACEYKKSFLDINVSIAVITNIDNDHLDYYGTMNNLIATFKAFVEKVPEDGFIVVDRSLPYMDQILSDVKGTIVDVSKDSHDFELLVPGEHMKKNARLAAKVASLLTVPTDDAKEYLQTFESTWRRSQYIGITQNGALVFDDYGHHPTEIQTTLEGFRQKYQDKKIVVIFQPHLFSRTKILFNDFLDSFHAIDTLFVAPIYAAREEDTKDISSAMLVDGLIEKGVNAKLYKEEDFVLLQQSSADTIIITLGAGEMNKVSEALVG